MASSRAEMAPPRSRAAWACAGRRVRSVVIGGVRRRPRSVAFAEDGGNDHERTVAGGRVGEHIVLRERRSRDILAQDVLELDGLGRRGDVVGRDGGQDRVLIQDVVQLTLEPAQLVIVEPQAGQVGDVFDIGAREGGHRPDDSRDMPGPRLRPMTPKDIDPSAAAILADDWGDRRAWFAFAVAHPECRVVVAEADGSVVGTGVTTINGTAAWVGTIWVATPWRGHGLGRALTEATIDEAEAAGCRTLILVATDAGRPLYERLGFTIRSWYRTMEAPGRGRAGGPAARATTVIRPYETTDLEAMARLDAAATGEDRSHLLRALATTAGTRVAVDADDRPQGFLVRAPWGGGATIAPDPDVAMAILDARRDAYPADRTVRAGVLEGNRAGLARLEADGWTEAWRAPRLERGALLEWDPPAIWGQFNHALG